MNNLDKRSFLSVCLLDLYIVYILLIKNLVDKTIFIDILNIDSTVKRISIHDPNVNLKFVENSNFTLFFKINNLIPFIFSIHVSLITQWLQDSNMLPKSVKVSFFLFLTPRNMSSLTKWYTYLAVPFLSCFCSSKLACLDRGSLGVSTTEDWIVGYRK